MPNSDILLIGVDGGATEVKAHAVTCDNLDRPTSFKLRGETASRVYRPVAEFVPVPVADQLAERDANRIHRSAREIEQARMWVTSASDAVGEVAQACGARRILVGIGMPGLKTPDRRGINAMNNGPRIPDYLDMLERLLAGDGLELVSPVAALGSDADYCGLGEEYAAEGLFRDVSNAYYIGCGTGIADAMKLRGRLVPFDDAKSWIQKSWQMPSALGPTFERLVAAKSINRVYAGICGCEGVYPEVDAKAGSVVATAWMDTVALVLAELVFERLQTIADGRMVAPHRGESYAQLEADHEYRGLLLDRVIIGQRIGRIYREPIYRDVFGDKMDTCLAALIAATGKPDFTQKYLASDPASRPALKPGFVQGSKLRAAPALGAAVAAVRARNSRAATNAT